MTILSVVALVTAASPPGAAEQVSTLDTLARFSGEPAAAGFTSEQYQAAYDVLQNAFHPPAVVPEVDSDVLADDGPLSETPLIEPDLLTVGAGAGKCCDCKAGEGCAKCEASTCCDGVASNCIATCEPDGGKCLNSCCWAGCWCGKKYKPTQRCTATCTSITPATEFGNLIGLNIEAPRPIKTVADQFIAEQVVLTGLDAATLVDYMNRGIVAAALRDIAGETLVGIDNPETAQAWADALREFRVWGIEQGYDMGIDGPPTPP